MSITFTVGDDNHLAGPERQEPITITGTGATPGSTVVVTFGSGQDAITFEIEVPNEPEWDGWFEGRIFPDTHADIYALFEAATPVSAWDGTQGASILVTIPGEGAVLSAPTVTTSSGAALVRAGQTISFDIASDQPVSVNATPYLDLGEGRRALYSAEDSTSTALRFVYTVQTTDHGDDLTVLSLNLNGGRILTDDGASAYAPWGDIAVEVEIDTQAPATPDVEPVAGDNRINLVESRGQVTIQGVAEADSSVEITLGGQTRMVVADAAGAYSYTLTADDVANLGQGAQIITVAATDAAGNTSQAATRSILVDTVAPAAPTVTTIAGDGVINAAEAQDLIITGAGEAGATAHLRIGGTTFQAAVVDGAYNFPVSADDVEAMGQGSETLTLWLTDEACNVGASTTRTLTVDTVAPDKPTIAQVAGDDTIDASEGPVVIRGTAQAGSSVSLSLAGLMRDAHLDGSEWTYTLTADDIAAMGQGDEQLSVAARDAAGNISETATRQITISTAPPAAPQLTAASIDGARLTLTYDSDLDVEAQIDPAAFSVLLGGAAVEVASVSFNGARKVVLTLDVAASHGQAVTLAYADPDPAGDDEDVVQDTLGVDAPSFAGRAVRNDTGAPDAGPPPAEPTDPVDPTPPPPQPGQQPGVIDLGRAATGADLGSAKAAAPTVTLADGRVVDNPLHQTAMAAEAIAARVEAGLMTAAQAQEALIELAMPTMGVAHDAYRFFTGSAPSAEGLAWLIDSEANPNDLTDAYYAGFSPQNRYINFAVNLGLQGEGAAAFAATWADLSFEAAVKRAYGAIIGEDEARAASIDLPLALDYIESQEAYFRALGGGDLGAKAAMIGYVISQGVRSEVGLYYDAAHDFIARQIELAGVAYPAEGA